MSNPQMTRRVSGLIVGALILIAAPLAQAFVPVEQNGSYEIPLPAFGNLNQQSFARDMGVRFASDAVSARYGGHWQAYSWNAQTGTPRYVYGTGADLGVIARSEGEREQIARQVIADNPEVFHAEVSNLRLLSIPSAMGKWVAHFQQTYEGLDVQGGRTLVAFSDAGRLLLMSSDYHSGIRVNPQPALTAAQAEAVARGALPFNPQTDRMEGDAELIILPVPLSASELDDHLAWRLRVRTEDPLGVWVTHVDAQDGTILWRYNDIYFAYSGDTESDAHDYGYCDGAAAAQAMPYLNIGVTGLGTTTSDENGDWWVDGTGGFRQVTAELEGPYCHVYENVLGPEALFSGVAQENVPFTVDFNAGNSQQDERDVFDSVNDVHDFFLLFAPSFSYINQQIGAEVSMNSTCNAYWDGNIHFYRQGGGCANTGELQQVVHHEFGHGVQATLLGGPQGNEGLGEGNADILGNLITQDPVIGRGFNLNYCAGGIRNSDNDLFYPDHVIGQEIHYAGQVIAGFNWDAMLQFQNLYGVQQGTIESAVRWHVGRLLLQPMNQPDQVFATFFADDDDFNMDNGTPHHSFYCESAEHHGFECPNAFLVSQPDAATIWTHGEATGPVSWAGSQGGSVRLDLYRGSTLIASLSGWTANDGTEVPAVVVDPAWGSGDDFRVRVLDDNDVYGYSRDFGIYGPNIWTDASQAPVNSTGPAWGASWGDHDGDGSPDIYLVNGPGTNHLFANDGNGAFTDVSAPPIDDAGFGRASAWADYDNDGDQDLYLSNSGGDANALFRNDGGGSFTDIASGLIAAGGNNRGIAWGDYDNDGRLDLFLVRSFASDRLFHNDGGGAFTDVTAAPLGDAGGGRSAVWGDYDNDGDLDLYLVKSSFKEFYRNNGDGSFTETAGALGINDNGSGFGACWGDYDNDGDLDLYLGSNGPNKLYRNDGGVFTNVTAPPLDDPSNTQGVAWGDYDNDGLLDLFLANYGPDKLLRNLGGGVFTDTSNPLIANDDPTTSVAWADMDSDGDLDLYLSNYNSNNRLLRNDSSGQNHWLHVDLRGTESNRDGVGARVRLVAGGNAQYRQVGGDTGGSSQSSLTVEFGLGSATLVDTLEIRWPSGIVQRLFDLAADQRLSVEEAGSTAAPGDAAPGVRLLSNHPNPFNPATTIPYSLGRSQKLRLAVYDIAGRELALLVDGIQPAGRHEVVWRGVDANERALPSGIYLVRLDSEDGRESRKIVLLK